MKILLPLTAILAVALWGFIFLNRDSSAVTSTDTLTVEDRAGDSDQAPEAITFPEDSSTTAARDKSTSASDASMRLSNEEIDRQWEIARESVAYITVEEDRVDFNPNYDYAGFTLTISGPGGYRTEESFESGRTPSFSAPKGLEGMFKYELVGVPHIDAAQYQEMASRRAQGISVDLPGTSVDTVQSGTFSRNEGVLNLHDSKDAISDQDKDNL